MKLYILFCLQSFNVVKFGYKLYEMVSIVIVYTIFQLEIIKSWSVLFRRKFASYFKKSYECCYLWWIVYISYCNEPEMGYYKINPNFHH